MVIKRLALAALVAGLGLPATASAHAVLEQTDPRRGAALETAPEQVSFAFNEPVEVSFGAVRVYDRAGERVDSGEISRPQGGSDSIAIDVEPGLEDGIYTATYRVLSADSHPVAGGFTFTVGDPGAAAAVGVDELIDDAGAGAVTETALGIARVATYAATAILIGGVVFLLFAWAPALAAIAGPEPRWLRAADAFALRLRRLLVGAAIGGGLATAAGIVLQGAVGLGASFWDALRPSVVEEVLATRFGTVWGLRLLDIALLATLLFAPAIGLRFRSLIPARLGAGGVAPARPLPANPVVVAVLGLGLGFLALAPGLAGHAGAADPGWVLVPANLLHVVAFAVWVGGLVALAARDAGRHPRARGRREDGAAGRRGRSLLGSCARLRRGAAGHRDPAVGATARSGLRPGRDGLRSRDPRQVEPAGRLDRPRGKQSPACPAGASGACRFRIGSGSGGRPAAPHDPGRDRPGRGSTRGDGVSGGVSAARRNHLGAVLGLGRPRRGEPRAHRRSGCGRR